jgi:hypothetical protein
VTNVLGGGVRRARWARGIGRGCRGYGCRRGCGCTCGCGCGCGNGGATGSSSSLPIGVGYDGGGGGEWGWLGAGGGGCPDVGTPRVGVVGVRPVGWVVARVGFGAGGTRGMWARGRAIDDVVVVVVAVGDEPVGLQWVPVRAWG